MGTCLYKRKPGVSCEKAPILTSKRSVPALPCAVWLWFTLLWLIGSPALAEPGSGRAALANFDRRQPEAAQPKSGTPAAMAAAARLRVSVPEINISLDPVLGTPRWLASSREFLTGPNGDGGAVSPMTSAKFPAKGDPHRAVRTFLSEHRALFGYGPEVLIGARVGREFVGSQTRLRTVVWQQQLQEIDVFEGQLQAHLTAAGELVSLSSLCIAEPAAAALRQTQGEAARVGGSGSRRRRVSAREAIAFAATNLGEE